MCENINEIEKPVKIDQDIYKVLEMYEIITKKPMERILHDVVKTGTKQIKAQLNELPHTNMNKILKANGLIE